MAEPPALGWNIPNTTSESSLVSCDSKTSKKKRTSSLSSSSSSTSSSSSSSQSDNEKQSKKKKSSPCRKSRDERKKEKEKRRAIKKEKRKLKKMQKEEYLKEKKKLKKLYKSKGPDSDDCGVPIELMNFQAKAPETREQFEARQNKIRRITDPETGRQRLVKGDGEILEEIVSRDRHKDINRQATRGDGNFFESKTLGKQ